MQVAVHWQDADSSSAKAVSYVFPDAEIMICGGHAGRAHKKILELRHKMKSVKDDDTKVQRSKILFLLLVSCAVNVRGATTVLHVGA